MALAALMPVRRRDSDILESALPVAVRNALREVWMEVFGNTAPCCVISRVESRNAWPEVTDGGRIALL